MSARAKPILVVGGGIGGLAVALALGRRGWSVRVLEETPEFGAIGYGIQLGPNVFPMFEQLGVADAMVRESIAPPALVMLDALDGSQVARVPTGKSFRRRFKHPYIVLHGVDLHRVLLDACKALRNIALEPSTSSAGFEDLGDGVRLRIKEWTWSGAGRSPTAIRSGIGTAGARCCSAMPSIRPCSR